MADAVKIARAASGCYLLTVSGKGFGERMGQLALRDANGDYLAHVNPVSWNDREITAEVPDTAMGGNTLGISAGDTCEIMVLPAPGFSFAFEVQEQKPEPAKKPAE